MESEPYGLASLGTHKGFRIKGIDRLLAKFYVLCFMFSRARARVLTVVPQLLNSQCVQEVVLSDADLLFHPSYVPVW